MLAGLISRVIQPSFPVIMKKLSVGLEPIIRLNIEEIPAAAAVHTHAFLTDPYTVYLLKDDHKRPRQLFAILELGLRYCCRYGEVYATPGMEAIAAWMPPGQGHESSWRMIRSGALPVFWSLGLPVIRSYLQIDALAEEMQKRHIRGAHWYLSQLAVEPELQGKGYGHQVLAPTLERIDDDGQAAYLETLNPKAIPFYQKLGFQICEEINLPEGGPPMWSMLREPIKGRF
jgi:ribosomal protein S18 acetylase RimI-like enzyme